VLVGVGLGETTAVGVGATRWHPCNNAGTKLQTMLSAMVTLTTQMMILLPRPE